MGRSSDDVRLLHSLRTSYRQRLPAKLRELEMRLQAVRALASAACRDEVRVLVHTLKGTAGSYGFVELSAELGTIESVLEDVAVEEDVDAAGWSRIEEALSRSWACLG